MPDPGYGSEVRTFGPFPIPAARQKHDATPRCIVRTDERAILAAPEAGENARQRGEIDVSSRQEARPPYLI